MRYYNYRQNNSGGYFAAPAVNVIVPAENAEEANAKVLAADIGVYFGGSGDCPCCGDRWYELSDDEYDLEWKTSLTLEAAIEAADTEFSSKWAEEDGVKTYLVLD